jgi:ribosomal protein L11 methyltransferase
VSDGDDRLWRVAVRARRDEAEALRARLLELAPTGFEELDVGDEIELALYARAPELAGLRGALESASVSPVEEGWEEAWRTFHRPVHAAGLWLGPPWEVPPDRSRAVVIDPGRAFGTGAHPTTRLCVELLAGVEGRGSLLDVGCGSGVLGIAATRLGFGPVVCVDSDPVAVETTRANADANDVVLDVRLVDALRDPLPAVDVAVANVLLEPVEAILSRLGAAEAITSGYPAGERPAHPGWSHVETLELDGWAADRFRRPA